jgi:hypothetical protein
MNCLFKACEHGVALAITGHFRGEFGAGILDQSMGTRKPSRNRVVVPARQASLLAESIPCNRFPGSLKV